MVNDECTKEKFNMLTCLLCTIFPEQRRQMIKQTQPCRLIPFCTTIHRYPILSMRYTVMCKVYTGYCGTSEIEYGLCACTVDNPLVTARGLSLRTGAQTMLYLTYPLQVFYFDFSYHFIQGNNKVHRHLWLMFSIMLLSKVSM